MIILLLSLIALGVHFHIAFIKRQWYADPVIINNMYTGPKPE